MQIIINASDLMNALNIVTRAISSRPAKKILEGVLIDAIVDEVTLTCTDTKLVIQSTIMATVNEPGRIVLPGKILSELVRKLPESEISIKTDSLYNAQINCLSSKSRLSGMNPIDFPEMSEILNGTMVSIPQNKFKDMINRVAFAVGTDESRALFTGVLMQIDNEGMHLVALDGFRLAMHLDRRDYGIEMPEEKQRIVIPGHVMNELSKILSDDETACDLVFNRSHVKAVFGNTVVASSLLLGEYIDFMDIIPKSFQTCALIKKSVLADAIDRAGILAREGKSNIIKIQFLDNQANVTAHSDQGDVLEVIDVGLQGPPLEIAFNTKYISDIIRNIIDEDIVMNFNTSVSPCVLTATENKDYLYLILPVRVFS